MNAVGHGVAARNDTAVGDSKVNLSVGLRQLFHRCGMGNGDAVGGSRGRLGGGCTARGDGCVRWLPDGRRERCLHGEQRCELIWLQIAGAQPGRKIDLPVVLVLQ